MDEALIKIVLEGQEGNEDLEGIEPGTPPPPPPETSPPAPPRPSATSVPSDPRSSSRTVEQQFILSQRKLIAALELQHRRFLVEQKGGMVHFLGGMRGVLGGIFGPVAGAVLDMVAAYREASRSLGPAYEPGITPLDKRLATPMEAIVADRSDLTTPMEPVIIEPPKPQPRPEPTTTPKPQPQPPPEPEKFDLSEEQLRNLQEDAELFFNNRKLWEERNPRPTDVDLERLFPKRPQPQKPPSPTQEERDARLIEDIDLYLTDKRKWRKKHEATTPTKPPAPQPPVVEAPQPPQPPPPTPQAAKLPPPQPEAPPTPVVTQPPTAPPPQKPAASSALQEALAYAEQRAAKLKEPEKTGEDAGFGGLKNVGAAISKNLVRKLIDDVKAGKLSAKPPPVEQFMQVVLKRGYEGEEELTDAANIAGKLQELAGGDSAKLNNLYNEAIAFRFPQTAPPKILPAPPEEFPPAIPPSSDLTPTLPVAPFQAQMPRTPLTQLAHPVETHMMAELEPPPPPAMPLSPEEMQTRQAFYNVASKQMPPEMAREFIFGQSTPKMRADIRNRLAHPGREPTRQERTTPRPEPLAPPAPPPRPDIMPAPPEPAMPLALEERGAIGPAFRAQVLDAMRRVPEQVLQTIAAAGAKMVAAPSQRTAYPEFGENFQFRGHAPGAEPGAFYAPGKREAFIAEERRTGGGETIPNEDVSQRIIHELGHAFDHALGQRFGALEGRTDSLATLSQGKPFQKAYERDAMALRAEEPAVSKQYRYLLQEGQAGPDEAFATAFAHTQGETPKGMDPEDFGRRWSNVLGYMNKIVPPKPAEALAPAPPEEPKPPEMQATPPPGAPEFIPGKEVLPPERLGEAGLELPGAEAPTQPPKRRRREPPPPREPTPPGTPPPTGIVPVNIVQSIPLHVIMTGTTSSTTVTPTAGPVPPPGSPPKPPGGAAAAVATAAPGAAPIVKLIEAWQTATPPEPTAPPAGGGVPPVPPRRPPAPGAAPVPGGTPMEAIVAAHEAPPASTATPMEALVVGRAIGAAGFGAGISSAAAVAPVVAGALAVGVAVGKAALAFADATHEASMAALRFAGHLITADSSISSSIQSVSEAYGVQAKQMKQIPVIGGLAARPEQQMADLYGAISGIFSSLDQMVDRYAMLNPALAMAQAQADVRMVLGDIERAQTAGPQLAKYVAQRAELQQKFEDQKIKMLEKIIPFVEKIMPKLEKLLDFLASKIEDLMGSIPPTLSEMLHGVREVARNTRDDESLLDDIEMPVDIIMKDRHAPVFPFLGGK